LGNAQSLAGQRRANRELALLDRRLATTVYPEIIEPIVSKPARVTRSSTLRQATCSSVPMTSKLGCITCWFIRNSSDIHRAWSMFTRIRQVNDCKKRDFVNGTDQLEPGAQRFASKMDEALASGGNGVQEGGTDGAPSAPPAISLPKGGAIRCMGKKFVANPVTGSMNVPIYASQGHSGSGLQFSLSYNFGAGNGPCGFGCGLSVSEIPARRTRGCPSTGKASQPGGEDLLRQALVSEAR
jgi:hypothetical protein